MVYTLPIGEYIDLDQSDNDNEGDYINIVYYLDHNFFFILKTDKLARMKPSIK
jgi:hypothetical protein